MVQLMVGRKRIILVLLLRDHVTWEDSSNRAMQEEDQVRWEDGEVHCMDQKQDRVIALRMYCRSKTRPNKNAKCTC
jgi:hypothetical protein